MRALALLIVLSLCWTDFTYAMQMDPTTLSTAPDWLDAEARLATAKILEAISRPDARPGVVIASPSKTDPNYYFHWVRDAALTMDAVVGLAQQDSRGTEFWEQRLNDYVLFSRLNQISNTLTGLGEPKFNIDGSPYDLPWGRPQNDSPALRSVTLVHYAELLLSQGNKDYVSQKLYDGLAPSQTVIKADLDYVSAHWQEPCFDLWEEVKAEHFYTRMVQRKAMLLGSALAKQMGDVASADWYWRQAIAIQATLPHFWSAEGNYIVASLNWQAGVSSKTSDLDSAVLLGVLHGNMHDGFFDFSDPKVISSLQVLINRFAGLYSINRVSEFPAYALGRYPEDQYNGSGMNTGGNPWVLTTLAAAEAFYETASQMKATPNSQNTVDELIADGDKFVQRVALHANPDGTLSEQIDHNSGYMVSAENLTWNYTAVMTTYWARQRAVSTDQ